jgi:acyl-coenzyme A synthetase/AMP-(fatty) acid ligase
MELDERIADLMASEPDGPIAQYEGRWWTWRDFRRVKDALDAIFVHAGVEAGEGVGLVLRQRPQSMAACLAVFAGRCCGVLVTPIQPDLAMAEDIRTLRLKIVVAEREDWDRSGVIDAAREASSIGVELTGDTAVPIKLRDELKMPGRPPYYEAGRNVAVTVLTSGTTGPPKRIPVSYDLLRGTPPTSPREPWKRGVNIAAVPLVSIGGVVGMTQSVWRGRPTALMERFDVRRWAELVHEHKPRQLSAPPAALRMMLDAKIPKEMLASGTMFIAGSAPVDLATSDEFEETYGIPVVRSYGATEFVGNVMGFNPDELDLVRKKRGSVGRPRPGFTIRIVDPATGLEVATGEPGRLEVDSPRRAVGAPAGWIATNDLARVDADGFVWILGRADSVLIRGGFKVSTEEVAAVLQEHPAVADAAVTGLPDPRVNQVPVAIVVRKPGAEVSEEELATWVKQRKPPYCVPVRLLFVDAVPRNAMMKVMPPQVRALVDRVMAEDAT